MRLTKKELEAKIAIIKETGQKTCFDCLHCKVSAEKQESKTMYFCEVSKNKIKKEEVFWLAVKKVCKNFDDMDDEKKRRPLLRKRDW